VDEKKEIEKSIENNVNYIEPKKTKRVKMSSKKMKEWINMEESLVNLDENQIKLPVKRSFKDDSAWVPNKRSRMEEIKEDKLLELKMEK
jgi:hypothetical protein